MDPDHPDDEEHYDFSFPDEVVQRMAHALYSALIEDDPPSFIYEPEDARTPVDGNFHLYRIADRVLLTAKAILQETRCKNRS